MFLGIWNTARANKENIFYTVLTIFLLERVRRGWNRIESRGKAKNLSAEEIGRKQQTFTFGAALLYALPFLLPTVKYIYRSMDELSAYVNGLSALHSIWVFLAILVLTEGILAILFYNLLGIYVERMNGALGFFRKLGRSVVDGSKVAVQTVGIEAPARLYTGVSRSVRGAASTAVRRTRANVAGAGRAVRRVVEGTRLGVSKTAGAIASRAHLTRRPWRRRRVVEDTARS
jgi:hypothetical protein